MDIKLFMYTLNQLLLKIQLSQEKSQETTKTLW